MIIFFQLARLNRGGEADEGVRRAQLHSGEETEGVAELRRQSVSAFNLSLILRQLLAAGTPRELKNRAGQVFSQLWR